jgi:phage gpG-like protein
MNVSIDIDDQLEKALEGVIANIDKKKLLDAAGAALASVATRSFREADKRPSAWAPLKESTLKRKAGKGNTLIDTQNLMQSIIAQNSTGESIDVTSSARSSKGFTYGAAHQFGTKHMPARPFLPFDPATGELSEAGKVAVEDAVEAELKSMFADQ